MDKLQRIEKDGQAVLTTEQLAQAYGCDVKRISENFKRNADRFEEGQHYFKLEGDNLRDFKRESANCGIANNVNVLYLGLVGEPAVIAKCLAQIRLGKCLTSWKKLISILHSGNYLSSRFLQAQRRHFLTSRERLTESRWRMRSKRRK